MEIILNYSAPLDPPIHRVLCQPSVVGCWPGRKERNGKENGNDYNVMDARGANLPSRSPSYLNTGNWVLHILYRQLGALGYNRDPFLMPYNH